MKNVFFGGEARIITTIDDTNVGRVGARLIYAAWKTMKSRIS